MSRIKVVALFVWMVISFLVVEVFVFLPLYIVGVLAFKVAMQFADITISESRINKGQDILVFRNWALNEWLGNHEDGLNPEWWAKLGGTPFTWFLRNPVCNMRFWPIISTRPNAEKTWFIGSLDRVPDNDAETGWFFCGRGPYCGALYQGKRLGCWFGWKVNPLDRRIGRLGGPSLDYRFYGIGIASMVWRTK